MRLVHPNCELSTTYPHIIDNKEPFMFFEDEKSVRNFMPILSDKFSYRYPYVVFRKGAFKMDRKALAKKIVKANPKMVIFWDASCKDFARIDYLRLCGKKYIYLKKNISSHVREIHPSGFRLFPAPETMADRYAHMIMKYNIGHREWEKRSYDVVFTGGVSMESRKHRKQAMRRLIKACKELNLKYFIKETDKKKIPALKYAKLLGDSRLAFSFKGLGYRCRREWEVLAVGGLLVIDNILRKACLEMPDIIANEHFVFEKHMLKEQLQSLFDQPDFCQEIANRGKEWAYKSFIDKELSLDERFIRSYLLYPDANIRDPDGLMKAEKDIGVE